MAGLPQQQIQVYILEKQQSFLPLAILWLNNKLKNKA